jgi:SSS family transporter
MSAAPPSQGVLWAVVIAYMAVVTLAGAYYSKYMGTADAYFKAGNAVPWWAAGIAIYKANFTAYTFVAIASLVYMDGMAGLLLESGPTLAFLLAGVVFARRWHRLNLTSPPEYLEARFNSATRQTFSVLGIATTLLSSGMRLYAVCKLVESVMGLPLIWTIIIAGAVMITYTMLGGLCAVVVTDVLQFIILFLAVVPMFISSVAHIFMEGSWAAFVARIPSGYATFPHAEHGRTLGWLLAFWFSYLLDYNGDWGVIQMMCSTRTERDARKAAFLAMGFAIPHAFLLLGPCFVARVLWPGQIGDPAVIAQAETAYGRIALKLLPAGMIGVVAAAMLAATMSTLSVGWNVRSTSFVNDLYCRFLRPAARDKEKILVGRIAVVLIGAIATGIALLVALRSSGLFALAQSLIGFVVIPLILPLLMGLLVRRMQNYSGLAAFAACFAFACVNRWGYGLFGRGEPFPFHAEIVLSVLLGSAIMISSGYLPRSAADREKANRFFARIDSPQPAPPADHTVPSPVGVIGALTTLIGCLMLLLTMLPQSLLDRALTCAAAAVLIVAGTLMRRRERNNLAAAARAGV